MNSNVCAKEACFKQQLLFVLEIDSDLYHKMSLNEVQNVTDQISKCGASDSIVIFFVLVAKTVDTSHLTIYV